MHHYSTAPDLHQPCPPSPHCKGTYLLLRLAHGQHRAPLALHLADSLQVAVHRHGGYAGLAFLNLLQMAEKMVTDEQNCGSFLCCMSR
jgi:hypothetical protein